jgi:exosortase
VYKRQILTDLGVPVFDVAPACSGIRSLISLFAISTVYAFMRFDRVWKRSIVIAAAIPLAVLGNLARILIVLIVGRAVSFEAGAFIEQKLGFLTFLVAFAGLFLLGRQLKEKPDESPAPPPGLTATT